MFERFVMAAIAAALFIALFTIFEARADRGQSIRLCQDRAGFVYYAARSRDAGLTKEQYTDRVRQLVSEHPELGVSERDVQEMEVLIATTWASRHSKDQLYDETLTICMTRAEI